MPRSAVGAKDPTRAAISDGIESRLDAAEESARFDAWFDGTWQFLRELGGFNPLPRLLSFPGFNPWFIFRGLYQCCDPSTERRSWSTIVASKERCRSTKRDLESAAALTAELTTTISRLEKATINVRLAPVLRAVPASAASAITIEGLRELKANLSVWENRFAEMAKIVEPVVNQRSFKPNADLVILLFEHAREHAGREAPALFTRLLDAGYAGYHQHSETSSAALINLRKRFESKNRPIHAPLRAMAKRNSQLARNQPESERLPWRRGAPSDLAELKSYFHQVL